MKKYILAGRLIDGSGSEVKKRMALVEENGKILDVIAATAVPESRPEAIVDLSYCTILPPLMDCSVDLSSSASMDKFPYSRKTNMDEAADISRHIHFCHSHGVLGLADCRYDSTGVVPADLRRGTDETVIVRTAGQVYATNEQHRLESDLTGLDFVKIVHTSSIEKEKAESKGTENKEKENLRQLVQQAREKGRKTVVLANGKQGVREALEAGCDAIEQGYDMGEENLDSMISRKVLWIPCLVRAKMHLETVPASQKQEAERQLKNQRALLRQARSRNLPAAVGTGAGSPGVIHGEAVIEEIQQFIKSGYSLIEALWAASSVGADFFEIAEIGALQTGRPANFIVSRGMVQQLPRKLFYLENIYWMGKPSRGYQKNPIKTVPKSK